jgi:tetratricopeptide (TPR) repeat protein
LRRSARAWTASRSRRSTAGGSPRQATLEATIQWSYNLLSASERDAFLRLGVFQGDWSLEDAEAVLETPEALPLLESLVSHSLVVAQRTAHTVHFRFLETIREFARAQDEPSTVAAAGAAHAQHFATLIQRAAQQWLGPQQPHWVRWLETHQQELQVALSWLVQHDPLRGLELMVGLETFWTRQTGFPARRFLSELVQVTEGQRTPLQSAQGLRTLAMVTPDDTQSRAILQQAHALALEHNLEQELAECALAACLQEKQRDLTALRRHAQEAFERYGRLGDLYGQAHALEYDAIAALRQGDMVGAERGYTHFLVLARQLESPLNLWDAHYGLAQALLFQERLDEAEQTAAAAHALLSQAPDKMSRANLLLLLGELARFKSRADDAQAHYAESLQLCHENTIHVLPAFIERSRAIVFANTGNFPAAWASLQWALVEFRRYKISGQLGSTLAEMAWIAGMEGKHQEAALFAQQAQLAPPQDARYPHDQARLQQALATKTKTPQEPGS